MLRKSLNEFDVYSGLLVTYTNEADYLPGTLIFSADGSVIAVLNRSVTDEPTPYTLSLFDVVNSSVLSSEVVENAPT